ncbi:MAG: hypothetical protein J5J06_04020 [Phycisphaerae bacterium]|nr:hypothetical protein [Phycisphaerae bacterium]
MEDTFACSEADVMQPNTGTNQRDRGHAWAISALAALLTAVLLFASEPARAQSGEQARSPQEPAQQEQPAAEQEAAPENAQPASELDDLPPEVRRQVELRAQRRPSRVDEIVKNLNPETLNKLIGANVQVEYVGGQLVLKGPEEAVRTIELLLKALDRDLPTKVVRVLTLNERDAKEVARTVQDALRDVYLTPNQREEDQVTLTALTSTILLVSAPEEQIDDVVAIIEEVDAVPDPLGKIELMTFEVKNRRASDVAKELQKVLEQIQKSQGQTPDKSKIQIIPNNANNTITITARERERDKLQSLIDNIDVEPSAKWGNVKLTVYPLLHSKSADLAKVIQDLLKIDESRSSAQREAVEEFMFRMQISRASPDGTRVDLPPIDLQKPMRIIADDGTNSLIVATVEENIEPMGELIRLLDGVPLGSELAVRLFPLRFADADTVRETLQSMFDKGKDLPADPDGSGQDAVPGDDDGKALVYAVGLAADQRTNTLIVSGRLEQLRLAERVVSELDRPTQALKFPLRLLTLQHSDATRIQQMLTDLFDKRMESIEKTNAGPSAIERERVYLTVDLRSNSLLVSASEENMAEIRTILDQLDTPPAATFPDIRLIGCARLSAIDLKKKIEDLWKRKADLRRESELLEDIPVVAVDERSNTLIVASSVEDFQEIAQLVEVLEAQPLADDTELFKLAHADATLLSDLLDKLFEGVVSGSETLKAPTILPDVRSNALVVAGSRDMIDRVAQVLKRLDVPGGPNAAVIQVYPLEFAASAKLAPRIQELFDARGEGQQTTRTAVVVFADESSNSLVCSASRDDQSIVSELITVLDRPSSIAKQFEIFPLKMAKAAAVADKLEALFQSQAEGSSGRADAMAVQADERTNSLIVWAAPSEMTNIGDIINRLDKSGPAVEMMVKVIQLRHALAEEFATLLEDTFVGQSSGEDNERAVIINFDQVLPDGTVQTRKLLKQDIKVKPDPRTNSLMVMAPADSMGMLQAMIEDFDRIRPIRSEIRLFPLVNSDAESMIDKLKEIFSEGDGGGTGAEGQVQSQLVLGGDFADLDMANVGQRLRFSADPRTNTLIAAGAEVDLRMVESLVYFLDAQSVENRMVNVVPTNYRNAQDIAAAIQSFVQQEQEVYNQIDSEESQRVKAQRQVSVESLGGEQDKGSSHLIVGTSRQAYQQTMEMIAQLDRPEPQVRISMLIAEITITDDVELGMELAGQDLRFTEGAVVGPNGVIKGGDFDWVLGTEVGAAGVGLGGLSFTLTGEDFSFLFHTLQQQTSLEVLSRPTLVVRNGEEGNITIADQVPVVESSQLNDTGSTNSVIGREDVGIVLTATPRISPEGYVTVELKQEISNIGDNIQLTEGVTSPIFSTREVSTNVTIRDGETVLVGGLIQRRTSDSENKVPILGDLPLIGPLFRFTRAGNDKTELMIVLTAEILKSAHDAKRMSNQELDLYTLPPAVAQSPLLEGLRIVPDENAMGGKSRRLQSPASPERAVPGPMDEPEVKPSQPTQKYGPEPKTYGPTLTKPTTTTASAEETYGPRLVRKADVAVDEATP